MSERKEQVLQVKYDDDHVAVFGTRFHPGAWMKAKLLQIEAKLYGLWEGRADTYRMRKPQGYEALRAWVKDIVGFDDSTLRRWRKEIKDNDGYVCDPYHTGPERKLLEEEHPDLDEFVAQTIEKETGVGGRGRVKLEDIISDWIESKQVYVHEKKFRSALRRLGYRYAAAQEVFISRRNSPDTQEQLKKFVKFVHDNTEEAPSKYKEGEMVFTYKENKHVCYTDASWTHSNSVDRMMWGKGPRTVDGRSRGARIALLDGIFPHALSEKGARVSWNTRTKKVAGREFFGNVTGALTRAHVGRIFKAFGEQSGGQSGTVICDNASVYRECEEKLSQMTEDELYAWILDNDPEADAFSVMVNSAPAGVVNHKWMMKHVKSKDLKVPILQKLANERGHVIYFLPPYWPECPGSCFQYLSSSKVCLRYLCCVFNRCLGCFCFVFRVAQASTCIVKGA